MKRTWIFVCSLALLATAGLAQPAPTNLTAALGISEPPACPGPAVATDGAVFAAGLAKAVCTANCGNGTTVTCSVADPGTCVAVDRNCSANERGYVSCGGVTTYCSNTCTTAVCTEGTTRSIFTGGCCPEGKRERAQQQCNNGQWQTLYFFCGALNCGPLEPIDPLDPRQ